MTEAGLEYTTRTGKEQNGVVDARLGAREQYFYTGMCGSLVEVKHETEERGAVKVRVLDRDFNSVEEDLEPTWPGETRELEPIGSDRLMVVHRS